MTVTGTEQRVYGTLVSENCEISMNRFRVIRGSTLYPLDTQNPYNSVHDFNIILDCGRRYDGYITCLFKEENFLVDEDIRSATCLEIRICNDYKNRIVFESYGELKPEKNGSRAIWFNKGTEDKIYNSKDQFPEKGISGINYFATDINKCYIWNDEKYEIGTLWYLLNFVEEDQLMEYKKEVMKFKEKNKAISTLEYSSKDNFPPLPSSIPSKVYNYYAKDTDIYYSIQMNKHNNLEYVEKTSDYYMKTWQFINDAKIIGCCEASTTKISTHPYKLSETKKCPKCNCIRCAKDIVDRFSSNGSTIVNLGRKIFNYTQRYYGALAYGYSKRGERTILFDNGSYVEYTLECDEIKIWTGDWKRHTSINKIYYTDDIGITHIISTSVIEVDKRTGLSYSKIDNHVIFPFDYISQCLRGIVTICGNEIQLFDYRGSSEYGPFYTPRYPDLFDGKTTFPDGSTSSCVEQAIGRKMFFMIQKSVNGSAESGWEYELSSADIIENKTKTFLKGSAHAIGPYTWFANNACTYNVSGENIVIRSECRVSMGYCGTLQPKYVTFDYEFTYSNPVEYVYSIRINIRVDGVRYNGFESNLFNAETIPRIGPGITGSGTITLDIPKTDNGGQFIPYGEYSCGLSLHKDGGVPVNATIHLKIDNFNIYNSCNNQLVEPGELNTLPGPFNF